MRVFKFGGASVKDAEGVKNLANILKLYKQDKIVVVVSAMGKTTNALEHLLSLAISGKDFSEEFKNLETYHQNIIGRLFEDESELQIINLHLKELNEALKNAQKEQYDFHYDQVVSKGELMSTTIIYHYLVSLGLDGHWLDARSYISSDSTHRSAKVDLEETEIRISALASSSKRICITQGFVAGDKNGKTTTLGREGSDYSAALFAYALKTEELIIWKDVDGVFNADPKIFSAPQLIEQLSYKEAIELAFYGASIIHPKTIQPLSERGIVLKVKSFYSPTLSGTLIQDKDEHAASPTSVIVKKNQLLLSLVPHDLSFMDLPQINKALEIIAQHRHQVNLMQNSAVSFSVCLDSNVYHFDKLIEELKEKFVVRYNSDLVLVTIRNYKTKLVDKIYENIQFKLDQRNRSTYQVLVDDQEFEQNLHGICDACATVLQDC